MRYFLILLLAVAPAGAQESDNELLREILCELKELRAAVRQGQVYAPLVDANLREREQVRKQVMELEQRVQDADQGVQAMLAAQAQLREQQRRLPTWEGRTLEAAEAAEFKRQLEVELSESRKQLETQQQRYSRAVADRVTARSELNLLEQEFSDLQRQMRSIAAAGQEVCGRPVKR